MKKLILLLLSLLAFNVFASPVNINTADAKTISDALLGIGIKKAEAIVKYRTEKGLFKTPEDLTNVKGIGKKTFEKIKKDVLVSDTPGTESKVVSEPKTTAEPTAVVEPKQDKKPK